MSPVKVIAHEGLVLVQFADVWKRLTNAPTTRPSIAKVVN